MRRTYGTPGFAVGHQPAGPVHPGLRGRAEMRAGALGWVVVEASGRDPIRDAAFAERVDLATQ